jgi:ribose 5-phosphate isomerase B
VKQKILIAADHGGFELKTHLISVFKKDSDKFEFIDLGTSSNLAVDYPDYAKTLCTELLTESASFGILICGSGQGMAISANRIKGIRAAVCWDEVSAKLSREHNNANILCLGARLLPFGLAEKIVRIFLATTFSASARHEMRIKKIEAI